MVVTFTGVENMTTTPRYDAEGRHMYNELSLRCYGTETVLPEVPLPLPVNIVAVAGADIRAGQRLMIDMRTGCIVPVVYPEDDLPTLVIVDAKQ